MVGRQLVKAGTSVGANYRAACRGKSAADFANKVAICEEEADESGYWMEVIVEAGQVSQERAGRLINEASQLTAFMVAIKLTTRRRFLS